jgi:hypothetical protein
MQSQGDIPEACIGSLSSHYRITKKKTLGFWLTDPTYFLASEITGLVLVIILKVFKEQSLYPVDMAKVMNKKFP